ncbi:hypothetical protein CLU79DRAFT_773486 [Phycomyces nitens]|nr:hypothetical protein CLU79DRAFT_773486 [Phycomyces nitens]
MVSSNQPNSQWDFDAPRYRDFSQVHDESVQSDTWLANRLETNPRTPKATLHPNTPFGRSPYVAIKRPLRAANQSIRDLPSIKDQSDSRHPEPPLPNQQSPRQASPSSTKSKAKPSILAGPFTLSQPLSTSSSTATERYVPNRPPNTVNKGKEKDNGLYDHNCELYSISQPMETQSTSLSTSPITPQKPSLGPTRFTSNEPPLDTHKESPRNPPLNVEAETPPLKRPKTDTPANSNSRAHYMPRFSASNNSAVRTHERSTPGPPPKKPVSRPTKSFQRDSVKEKVDLPAEQPIPESRINTPTTANPTKVTEATRKAGASYVPRFSRFTTPNGPERKKHEPKAASSQTSLSLSLSLPAEEQRPIPLATKASTKAPTQAPMLTKATLPPNSNGAKYTKPPIRSAQRIPVQQQKSLSQQNTSNTAVKKGTGNIGLPLSKYPDTLHRSDPKPWEEGQAEKTKPALFSNDMFKKQLQDKQREIKSKHINTASIPTTSRPEQPRNTFVDTASTKPTLAKDSPKIIKQTTSQSTHQTTLKPYSHSNPHPNTSRRNGHLLSKGKEQDVYTNSTQRKDDLDEIFKGMETIRMELQHAQEATQQIVNDDPLDLEYPQRPTKISLREDSIEDSTQRALRVIAESKRRSRHWASLITSPTPSTSHTIEKARKEPTKRYSRPYATGQSYKSPYLPIEPTVAKSPVFATDSRMYLASRMDLEYQDHGPSQSTYSKPTRRKTFSTDGPLDLPPPKRARLTIPQSPEFLTDQRPPRKSYLDYETQQSNINNRHRQSLPLQTVNKRETRVSNQRAGLLTRANYDGSSFRERLEVWKNRARQEELASTSFSSML